MINIRKKIVFAISLISMLLTVTGCWVERGSGNLYTVGGTLAGLPPGESLVLQINESYDLTLNENGPFTFSIQIADGGYYNVTVLTEPSDFACILENRSGTITGTDVSDVLITITTTIYSIGGSLSGLPSGESITLRNNGGDDLTLTENGAFTFPSRLAEGAAYEISIFSRPQGKYSSVGNGTGTISEDITDISITVEDYTEVVTIYFCGTGVTEDWWNADDAHSPPLAGVELMGYFSPEHTSSLHHEQNEGAVGKYNHHKFIVNGVGTGTTIPFVDLFAQAAPSNPDNPRGWAVCLSEGNSHLLEVMATTDGDVILNTIGHSRGGVLAMWLAQEAYSLDRVKSINIIAFDPVPGDDTIDEGIYTLNSKVKHYVGMYAEDERTNFFDPIIPRFSSSSTKRWMFTVPGAHSTLTGNYQRDGHTISFHSFDWWVLEDDFVDDLKGIGWVTKVITVELLGSDPWGRVPFDWSWSGGERGFESTYDAMDDYGGYEYMRTIGMIPFNIAAYWNEPKILGIGRGEGCHWCTALDMWPGEKYNQMRCAYLAVSTTSLDRVGLQDVLSPQTGEDAWGKIQDWQ